jgi:NADPH:quinone reductase-like Zn-dependent oxidoreductase
MGRPAAARVRSTVVESAQLTLEPSSTRTARKDQVVRDIAAGASVTTGLMMWQALFDHAGLRPGQHVFVHGAGGVPGAFLVQLAEWAGATVSATAQSAAHERLTWLGADVVCELLGDALAASPGPIDVAVDLVAAGPGTAVLLDRIRAGGTLLTIGPAATPTGRGPEARVRTLRMSVRSDARQLARLARLIDAGHLIPGPP